MSDEDYPAVGPAYELRFTQRALEDLRCPGLAPGDFPEIRKATPWKDTVDEFLDQRGVSFESTGGSLHSVGRGDIYPLHGPAGGRAATWYDPETRMCWFLGYSSEHEYELFEARAAADELLPSEYDETLLELEREELDFDRRVKPGLELLVRQACEQPDVPARGTIGDLIRLDVTAYVVGSDSDVDQQVDLWLVAHPPFGEPHPPGWPGNSVCERLASIISGNDPADLELAYPDVVPVPGGTRPVEYGRELVVHLIGWEPNKSEDETA